MNAYLIKLQNASHTEAFLVDEATWNFIRFAGPFPDDQLQMSLQAEDEEGSEDSYVYFVLENSNTANDRANMAFPTWFGNFQFNERDPTDHKVQQFLERHDLVLQGTFTGRVS